MEGKGFLITNLIAIKMLKQYETVFIATPVLSEEQIKEAVEKGGVSEIVPYAFLDSLHLPFLKKNFFYLAPKYWMLRNINVTKALNIL